MEKEFVNYIKSLALKEIGTEQEAIDYAKKEADRIADWIGSARRQIPSLTDRQENEMYDFLLDKDASKRFTRREDFVQKVASIVGTIGFNENSILNLKRVQNVTQGESVYDIMRGELEEKIKAKQAEIDDLFRVLQYRSTVKKSCI